MPTGTDRVPNLHPWNDCDYKIAIIGEAPGEEEAKSGFPFFGQSGYLLQKCLNQFGIGREHVLLANVLQYRPHNNDIRTVDPKSPLWEEGWKYLEHDLERFKPNVCVLLGNTALEKFTGKTTIGNWRGSIIPGIVGGKTYKCVPTYHPAAALRDYSLTPDIRFDLERAIEQSEFPEIRRQERILDVNLPLESLVTKLSAIAEGDTIAFDIEGGTDHMSCLAIATDSHYAFTIPFQTLQNNHQSGHGYSVWSNDDEVILMREIARVLENPNIRKITQNGISYDNFVLAWTYRICVQNTEDIMLLNWELFPEQKKSLGYQISIWIDEPYHKEGRKATQDKPFWEYCGKDACTTLEIWHKQNEYIDACENKENIREHYQFNRDVAIAMLYCSMHGMAYDTILVSRAVEKIRSELIAHQTFLDEKFGDLSWFVDGDIIPDGKVEVTDGLLSGLLFAGPQKKRVTGKFNVKSTPQKRKLLYDLKGYHYFSRKSQSYDSTDEMTLVTLANKYQDEDLWTLLRAIRCRTALSAMGYDENGKSTRTVVDSDGRIRFSYMVVGTETGRTSCYKSNTGGGFNGQTITKGKGFNMREFYLADPGYLYLQADLEGADSWTVASYCAYLGDESMLNHLLMGIKPAKVLRLVLQIAMELTAHGYKQGQAFDIAVAEVLSLSPAVLKQRAKATPDDELYRVCKAVGHGTCYKMGPGLVKDIIFKQTEGSIDFNESECKLYQGIYLKLYRGVPDYHEYIFNLVSQVGHIDCASGHRRRFLSIRWSKNPYGHHVIDPETHRQALAQEPQANTTYVTNEILRRLYYEDYNRLSVPTRRSPFIITPLHQVHDAINGQVAIRDVESGRAEEVFGRAKDITLKIAGYDIKIPIEVKLGPSWGKATMNLDGSPCLK